jgi:type VI secretion system protein ImpJ
MSWRSKVVWSQGMFLQPHHFQQEARHVENLVEMRVRGAEAHAWGFLELVLDEGALSTGRIGIVRASGVLPDGTPFNIPQYDAVPVALDVRPDVKDETIYLAAPVSRAGVTEVDFDDAAAAQELRRYRVTNEEVRDHTNASDDPEPLQTAAVNLRLIRARDATDGYALLGVAHVVERRSDNQVVLDRGYIAPQVRIDATGQLSATASLLHGLVQQRARLLASRMGQLSHGVSELADFLMLQSLNRAEPVLHQHSGTPHVHPNDFYLALLQLAGDLSTFTSEARHPPSYPLYKHDDLKATYLPVVEDLRRMLSVVLERNALQIDLVDRQYGVRTAVIPDPELARTATFVLAVNSQMPAEQLRQRFPAQSKLGPVDRIRDLVNLALPGVSLRLLPVAPRQLPFHAGFHYFELDRSGELWKQLERNGSLALHVGGDFPSLELELWAIRQ